VVEFFQFGEKLLEHKQQRGFHVTQRQHWSTSLRKPG